MERGLGSCLRMPCINTFVLHVPFSCSDVFRGVEKGCTGNKWVKNLIKNSSRYEYKTMCWLNFHNICRLFHVLTRIPFTTSETELDCHQKLNTVEPLSSGHLLRLREVSALEDVRFREVPLYLSYLTSSRTL